MSKNVKTFILTIVGVLALTAGLAKLVIAQHQAKQQKVAHVSQQPMQALTAKQQAAVKQVENTAKQFGQATTQRSNHIAEKAKQIKMPVANMSKAQFAEAAMLKVYDFNHKNMRHNLQFASKDFSKRSWSKMVNGLYSSGTLKVVAKQKLQVHAELLAKPRVVKTTTIAEQPVQVIQLPMAVNYQNAAGKRLTQQLAVTVAVREYKDAKGNTNYAISNISSYQPKALGLQDVTHYWPAANKQVVNKEKAQEQVL